MASLSTELWLKLKGSDAAIPSVAAAAMGRASYHNSRTYSNRLVWGVMMWLQRKQWWKLTPALPGICSLLLYVLAAPYICTMRISVTAIEAAKAAYLTAVGKRPRILHLHPDEMKELCIELNSPQGNILLEVCGLQVFPHNPEVGNWCVVHEFRPKVPVNG